MVEWDYTEHAAHYDKRADYSREAIVALLTETGCKPLLPVADIGAGTGKLTKELLSFGLTVKSVEPNDAMRAIGSANNPKSTWSIGTGEETGLPTSSVHAAFFGSSFNVVDQAVCLKEVARILVPGGWFGCMWNHRDLGDNLQSDIEAVIKQSIPGYSYGLRRQDPTEVIKASGLFGKPQSTFGKFPWPMSKADTVEAWRSHATLKRQAGDKFDAIITAIEELIEAQPDPLFVPYTTRIYFAQLTAEKDDLNAKLHGLTA